VAISSPLEMLMGFTAEELMQLRKVMELYELSMADVMDALKSAQSVQ